MSHNVGTVPVLGVPLHIGPDSGESETSLNTWEASLPHTPAPGGTKFVIVHFLNVSLPANNRLEVDLGYDTDVFSSVNGEFWTRPVNVAAVGGGTSVPIRYVTDGSSTGGAFVDRYARGESLPSHEPGHDSITNCDPFLPGPWVEPIFPHVDADTVPKYDPFWICDKLSVPKWQNVRCAGTSAIQRIVAPSVGMIVTVHAASADHPHESIGTCSVTLIDSDLVVLAGHCVKSHPFEVPTSSVTFDFEVACDGTVLPAYNPTFYKVIRLVKYRYGQERDYAILQLRGAPPVPVIPLRNSLPAVGESVFSVHHPNGAVKKTSPSAAGTAPVTSAGDMIDVNLDCAGGSSGSGLFDESGRILGVLAGSVACNLGYSAMATMLADPILIPDPPTQRAVMLVLDRSGSMSEPTVGGLVKIDEARDAAELFVSMLRSSIGNEAGLVSFSTNATVPPEFPLAPVTEGAKDDLIDLLPSIFPGGRTSIGDGLAAARSQFPNPGDSPRAILVLTDGMENEPQAIADVSGLAGIEITAIGFGTESNLDGARLSDLAQTRGGFYKRAGTGLELRKFFALAFGDIFEAGALIDPELHLPAGRRVGLDVPFHVCGEEAITVVVGWDTPDVALLVEVRTPDGQVVNLNAAGIEVDSANTWWFARIPLPHAGERDGLWNARVFRGGDGGEFPPPDVAVTCFINVIARGGPSLRPFVQPRRLYTGDVLHPKVILQFADETVPSGGDVTLTLRRPAASVGTILSNNGLGPERLAGADTIPARQATLSAIEQSTGTPVTGYVTESHVLTDDAAGAETFMPAGVFGKRLEEALVVEGNYSFHARASIGVQCTTTREAQWAHHVSVGIDPDSTVVVAGPGGSGPDGDRVRLTVTPKDRYGNHVGPGAGDELDIVPLPGCTLVGKLADLGDGRYVQELACDPDGEQPPGISIAQPERDPVVLVPPLHRRTLFRYAVKLICGLQPDQCCHCASVGPGRYTTAITVVNDGAKEASLVQRVVPTELSGSVLGRWPKSAGTRGHERSVLAPGTATTIDCCSVTELLLGAPATSPLPLTMGMVLIDSHVELRVIATYTVVTDEGASPSIDVETIAPSTIRVPGPVLTRQPPPTSTASPVRVQPPPRPQDTPKRGHDEQADPGTIDRPNHQRQTYEGHDAH